MATYGYARVSTNDQDLSIQEEALINAGCDIVRSEKVSGSKLEDRYVFDTLMQFLRKGDVLTVTRIDRLARSIRDLQNIVHILREKGVELRATEQPIDTSTAAGKAFLDMLGVFAEFELTSGGSVKPKGSLKPKKLAFIKAGNHPSTKKKFRDLSVMVLEQPQLRSGWVLAVRRYII